MAAAPPPPTPTKIIRVTGPARGRWRGGFGVPRYFTPEVQEFSDLTLTADEIAELLEDTVLKVEITPV